MSGDHTVKELQLVELQQNSLYRTVPVLSQFVLVDLQVFHGLCLFAHCYVFHRVLRL
jgi:hypothetical protein